MNQSLGPTASTGGPTLGEEEEDKSTLSTYCMGDLRSISVQWAAFGRVVGMKEKPASVRHLWKKPRPNFTEGIGGQGLGAVRGCDTGLWHSPVWDVSAADHGSHIDNWISNDTSLVGARVLANEMASKEAPM